MGIENKITQIATPSDALKLCEGFFKDKGIPRSIITDKNVLDAAEVLIAVDYAGMYISRANIIETALSFGWRPIDWDGPYPTPWCQGNLGIEKYTIKSGVIIPIAFVLIVFGLRYCVPEFLINLDTHIEQNSDAFPHLNEVGELHVVNPSPTPQQ